MDWDTLITQLIQLDSQPIIRMEERISDLETQQTGIRDLRTLLTTFRNAAQDFRLVNVFDAFQSSTSDDTVLTSTVSSSSPVTGSFEVNVTQLASSTVAESSAVLGSAINSSAALDSSGITTRDNRGHVYHQRRRIQCGPYDGQPG